MIRTLVIAASLVAGSGAVVGLAADSTAATPVPARAALPTWGLGDIAGKCSNAGHHGVFTGMSNEQWCTIGAWACVRSSTPNFPGAGTRIDSLPSGMTDGVVTVGLIMQPWDVNWHETGGNNGYVQNVCNGTAGSYNLHTLVPFGNQGGPLDPNRPNVDPRALHFSDQLNLIQRMCERQCQVQFISYHLYLDVWDDNPQTVHLSNRNSISRQSFEFMALSQYLSWNRITLDNNAEWFQGSSWLRQNPQGLDMGANGWQPQIVNTIRTGPHPDPFSGGEQMRQSDPRNLTGRVGDIVLRVVRLFLF